MDTNKAYEEFRISEPRIWLILCCSVTTALLAPVMFASIGWGQFLPSSVLSTMFMSSPYPSHDPYRWIYEISWGLLADTGLSRTTQVMLIKGVGILGVIATSAFWGVFYLGIQRVLRTLFYGPAPATVSRGKLRAYLMRTWFWNSLFAMSLGITVFLMTSTHSLLVLFIPLAFFIFLMWKQHRLNMWLYKDEKTEPRYLAAL